MGDDISLALGSPEAGGGRTKPSQCYQQKSNSDERKNEQCPGEAYMVEAAYSGIVFDLIFVIFCILLIVGAAKVATIALRREDPWSTSTHVTTQPGNLSGGKVPVDETVVDVDCIFLDNKWLCLAWVPYAITYVIVQVVISVQYTMAPVQNKPEQGSQEEQFRTVGLAIPWIIMGIVTALVIYCIIVVLSHYQNLRNKMKGQDRYQATESGERRRTLLAVKKRHSHRCSDRVLACVVRRRGNVPSVKLFRKY
ncbi:hypothetical protein Bbelb_426450 [Branchiostoma belcheri]|nr:hypothetical protein Bbelb_426450 [Branchiostoma belcheri]